MFCLLPPSVACSMGQHMGGMPVMMPTGAVAVPMPYPPPRGGSVGGMPPPQHPQQQHLMPHQLPPGQTATGSPQQGMLMQGPSPQSPQPGFVSALEDARRNTWFIPLPKARFEDMSKQEMALVIRMQLNQLQHSGMNNGRKQTNDSGQIYLLHRFSSRILRAHPMSFRACCVSP